MSADANEARGARLRPGFAPATGGVAVVEAAVPASGWITLDLGPTRRAAAAGAAASAGVAVRSQPPGAATRADPPKRRSIPAEDIVWLGPRPRGAVFGRDEPPAHPAPATDGPAPPRRARLRLVAVLAALIGLGAMVAASTWFGHSEQPTQTPGADRLEGGLEGGLDDCAGDACARHGDDHGSFGSSRSGWGRPAGRSPVAAAIGPVL